MASLYFNNIITIGSNEIVTPTISNKFNEIIYVENVIQVNSYPWWTTVATYLDSANDFDLNTVAPVSVRYGWVAFGDLYAAGIRVGTPLDTSDQCKRGTGSHTAILNSIFRYSYLLDPEFLWQPLGCLGETADQFANRQGSDQLGNWKPGKSDIATVSFAGNDVGFGNCIMGYPYGATSKCQADIQNAQAIVDSGDVRDLVDVVLNGILSSSSSKRLIVYWTGYPQFFAVEDHTCDKSYFQVLIFTGKQLNMGLRTQLNDLSTQMNFVI